MWKTKQKNEMKCENVKWKMWWYEEDDRDEIVREEYILLFYILMFFYYFSILRHYFIMSCKNYILQCDLCRYAIGSTDPVIWNAVALTPFRILISFKECYRISDTWQMESYDNRATGEWRRERKQKGRGSWTSPVDMRGCLEFHTLWIN